MRTDSVNHTNNSTTNLIITNNFRLFVADAYGVAEVHMPVMAKSLYLMLLRNTDGMPSMRASWHARNLSTPTTTSRTHSWMRLGCIALSPSRSLPRVILRLCATLSATALLMPLAQSEPTHSLLTAPTPPPYE